MRTTITYTREALGLSPERGSRCKRPIVVSVQENDCHHCISHRSLSGYPDCACRYTRIGKHYLHRLVYSMIHGPVPDGLVIRHRCDNGRCCNPDHLLVGTEEDNRKDRRERSRPGRSSLVPWFLSEEAIASAR